jgi:hypothetical protein
MVNVDRRVFDISIDYGFGVDSAHFYEDGTMFPEDRERILKEYGDKLSPSIFDDDDILSPEEEAILLEECRNSHFRTLENMGRTRLARILKAEAEYIPPTAEEIEAKQKADWITEQRKESEEYYGMMQDLAAWDNDSDDPHRPSIHWRTLGLYD